MHITNAKFGQLTFSTFYLLNYLPPKCELYTFLTFLVIQTLIIVRN